MSNIEIIENDQQHPRLMRKERKELRRQEKLDAREATKQKHHVKSMVQWIAWGGFGLAIVAVFAWAATKPPPPEEPGTLTRSGLHWHPRLAIYVKGVKQEIPANIGIGVTHRPIHTHDEDAKDGVLHLEFQNLVRRDDVKLAKFFETWNKDFMEFGANVTMTVNGENNLEFADYEMKDGDKIELRYQ